MITKPDESQIADHVSTLRQQNVSHPLFAQVESKQDLRTFMEAHVFAVWDFMSLVKRLQADFTTTVVPWTPPTWRLASRLMNDIVTGEESDIGLDGQPLSHYELYLAAMEDIGADTSVITAFVDRVSRGEFATAFDGLDVPEYVQTFVNHTIETACFGTTSQVVGSFFYGREDVIPDMFQGLLDAWEIDVSTVPQLVYYLERHIELDADEHGPAARTIVNALLERDENALAEISSAGFDALEHRIALWDGVLADVNAMRSAGAHWVSEAPDADTRAGDPDALSASERDELHRLRKEIVELRNDQEILRRAAADFARQAMC